MDKVMFGYPYLKLILYPKIDSKQSYFLVASGFCSQLYPFKPSSNSKS